ncbi:MAG: type II toxin-antitoxin system HicB family antitoxin [Verrucomicrobiota bacterium]
MEGMLMDEGPLPVPKSIEEYKRKRDYSGGIRALVDVDISRLCGKAKRVNITLPKRILGQIDSFASRTGESRSGLLAQAALEYVSAHDKE